LLKCNGHCEPYNSHRILVFRRAEAGETWKKNSIYISSTCIQPHTYLLWK
jgi:hypothetical protein